MSLGPGDFCTGEQTARLSHTVYVCVRKGGGEEERRGELDKEEAWGQWGREELLYYETFSSSFSGADVFPAPPSGRVPHVRVCGEGVGEGYRGGLVSGTGIADFHLFPPPPPPSVQDSPRSTHGVRETLAILSPSPINRPRKRDVTSTDRVGKGCCPSAKKKMTKMASQLPKLDNNHKT